MEGCVGAATVDSGVPQVLQYRAAGALLAPQRGHVNVDIVWETDHTTDNLELTVEQK